MGSKELELKIVKLKEINKALSKELLLRRGVNFLKLQEPEKHFESF